MDTLLGISTYDCPGGVHRSAKQSSPGLDPSRALRALFYSPERGNVSRYTREHRGVGYLSAVRCRCCCLVSGSIYSTRTHDLRNFRGSPMALSRSLTPPPFSLPLSISISLSLSTSLAHTPISSLFIPLYLDDLLLLPANQSASRIYGARNSDDARSSSRVTSGNSADSLSFSLSP